MNLPRIPTIGGSPCIENGCSACCRDTEMLLTEADVLRMSVHEPEPFWFQADDGYLQLKTRDEPDRPCWFLLPDGRCRVHEARPEGCRLYPAILGNVRVELDELNCPHVEGFRLPKVTADAVTRLVRRLDAERDARSQQA